MDNLKLPASPTIVTNVTTPLQFHQISDTEAQTYGFTKLEKAALMIAQGMISNPTVDPLNTHWRSIAFQAIGLAKMVLEEANK